MMPRSLTQTELDRIHAALADGLKIEAIKLYREASGAGLAEAKKFVEDLEAGRTPGTSPVESVTNDDIDQIQAAVFAGEKIKAIKLYRESTGEGLKESKDFIDALEEELRRTEPDKFTAAPAKGCGVSVFCLFVAAIVVASLALV
jgi:ribosomal protein L7/L12